MYIHIYNRLSVCRNRVTFKFLTNLDHIHTIYLFNQDGGS